MITGVMTSCPIRMSFEIDCLKLLILLMIAWISPRYPESIGGSSQTSPFTAMLLLGNTQPAYPSGSSKPNPRGTFIISPGFKVQSKGIYTSAPASFACSLRGECSGTNPKSISFIFILFHLRSDMDNPDEGSHEEGEVC